MAITSTPGDFGVNSFKEAFGNQSKFVNLGDFINATGEPDNRKRLVMIYGDERISTIYGLLSLVGAVKAAGTNDEVTWWEKPRLHYNVDGTAAASITAGTSTSLTVNSTNNKARVQDVILIYKTGQRPVRAFVTAATTNTYTIAPAGTWGFSIANGESLSTSLIGNSWAQGTNQPTDFIQPNYIRRTNGYGIIKDTFAATGSKMTNFSWIEIEGSKVLYHDGERDFRNRMADNIEMMHLLGESFTNSTITSLNVTGYQGYFDAIEERGIVNRGLLQDKSDFENLCKILDKEGGSDEYVLYCNRDQDFAFDNMAASLNSLASYGMFDNEKDMAMELQFNSISLGGRTFHKHSWKLMNSKELLGKQDYYKGVMIPMDTILDSKTGIESPLLEINYKSAEGYSREMESWMNGAANGVYNRQDGFDGIKWEMRGEQNLIARAANRHVLLA